MWLQFSTPPTAVRLDNFGAIESDALERVDGNENNTAVCVDAMLGISISDGVKYCRFVRKGYTECIGCRYAPEGSLRWESVAKSSAVSNRGGFLNGGRPSAPSLISFTVVFMTVSY